MGFIEDFIHYSSENECPTPFLEWSAITLLSAIAGRKIWHDYGSIPIDPRLYTCMVGTPGSGKSTAMGQAEKLFIRLFPDYMVSESIQSREDLLAKMTSEVCLHTRKNEQTGQIYEWRPFFCLVDEMENFVSVDEKKMTATLVGLYGRDSFGTGFKNDPNKNQRIKYPYLTLLACTIPEWMMSSLRESLFVGGLGRRMIIVHAQKTKKVPFPGLPPDHAECMKRMEEHLLALERHYGAMVMTPAAVDFWVKWFMDDKRKNKEDPILIQFHETVHIQALKIAMLFSLSENPKSLEIGDEHLKKAIIALKRLEKDIIRLTSGIGRNELAGVGSQVLDFLGRVGGGAPKALLLKTFGRYFRMPEFNEQMQMYVQSEQLAIVPVNGKEYYLLTASDYYEAWKNGKVIDGASLSSNGPLPPPEPPKDGC